MEFEKLKPGNILGESQYYTVEKVKGDKVQLKTDTGVSVVIDRNYVEGLLNSADQFETTQKISRTDMTNIFLSNANKVLTVNFNKQPKPEDVVEILKNVTKMKSEDTKGLKTIASSVLTGEERTMRGRHSGSQDEFGRIHFTDMDAERKGGSYDSRMRTVDPRTLNWLVINGVKYVVK